LDRALHVLGWVFSIAALAWGLLTVVSEAKYPGYMNSLIFAGGFIVFGVAVNPLVLRSVKLFGRASFTIVAGIIVALVMIGYASLTATI